MDIQLLFVGALVYLYEDGTQTQLLPLLGHHLGFPPRALQLIPWIGSALILVASASLDNWPMLMPEHQGTVHCKPCCKLGSEPHLPLAGTLNCVWVVHLHASRLVPRKPVT